jgi:hypothetical protein
MECFFLRNTNQTAPAFDDLPTPQVPCAVGVHGQRGCARLGEPVLRACASRAAALAVVAFWLHLLAKQKVENALI